MPPQDQSNRGYFFQSTASEDKNQRRQRKSKNENGNPLRLQAKVSTVCVDPWEGGFVFVADNGGVARRVGVEDRKVTHIYRTTPTSTSAPKPTFTSAAAAVPAPLTSLSTHPSLPILYAGSWDNSLYAWDVPSRRLLRRYTGHADFVKCLVCVRLHVPRSSGKETSTAGETDTGGEEADENVVLISGSADGSIIMWQASTGRRLHSVRAHTRGVLDLAVDPASLASAADDGAGGEAPREIVLFSASSLGDIRRWRVSAELFKETFEGPEDDNGNTVGSTQKQQSNTPATATPISPLTAHDTSVNRLHFPLTTTTSSSPSQHPPLWTASSDNTVLLLPRSPTASSLPISSTPILRLKHPDWVRDVAVDEDAGLVVTACRDEEVRVWDAEDGALVGVLRGHFDAVEAVCFVQGKVVSGGLDGTVRVWTLERGALEKTLGESGEEEVEEGVEEVEEEKGRKDVFTTEEEDRELAELMAEDD